MTLFDILIVLVLVVVPVAIGISLSKRNRFESPIENEDDHQSRSGNVLEINAAAVLFKLLGGLSLIGGLLISGSEGLGILTVLVTGIALVLIAIGVCIQYLFDIRNILLRREHHDYA